MENLIFWREWSKTPRFLYTFLLVVFLGTLGWFLYAYVQGAEGPHSWKVNSELDIVRVKLNSYKKGIFEIPLEGASYVVKEGFETTDNPINFIVRYAYGGLILLAMCFLLTVISSLKRLWYGIGMALFMLFLAWLGFGYLEMNIGERGLLIVSIALYGVASYYFQSFGKHLGLLPRLLAFVVITAGLATWISFATPVKHPVLYLTSFGWVIPIVLTMIFITMVSHDVLYGFFHLITKYNPGNPTNRIHFGIISVIYLGNLVLIYLKDRGNINLDIFYIDLQWLLALSAILGIWGFRLRGVTIRKFISFNPQGGLLYLSMGIVAFATLAFYQSTGNDGINSVMRDVILYSHIGYGVGFVFYVYVNLAAYMGRKVDVTQIAYQGEVIPHPMLRIIGVVFIFGFYSAANQIQRSQLLAGHYSNIAETYKANGNQRLTTEYYKIATQYFMYTYQPQYALGSLKRRQINPSETIEHFQRAILSYPTPYAYARLAQVYSENERDDEVILTLRQGVQKFPKSMELHNNLALAYSRTAIKDSTIYYFEKAEALAGKSTIPTNNLLAYLAANKSKNFDPKKLNEQGQTKQDIVTKGNRLALYNIYQTSYQQPLDDSLKVNPVLDNKKFTYIYNYLLNRTGKRDNKAIDSVLVKEVRKIEQNKANRDFVYFLQYVRACFQYYGGNVSKGIQILSAIPTTKTSGYYNVVLGLWLLEQGAYQTAISYLETAKQLKNTQADIYRGIALSEKGDIKAAAALWQELMIKNAQAKGVAKKQDSVALVLASKVMEAFSDTIALNTDEQKFILIHYRRKFLNDENISSAYNAIQSPNYKTWAAADLINHYLDKGNVSKADEIYKTLKVRELTDYIKGEINHAYLRLLNAQEKNDLILNVIEQLNLGTLYRNKKPYFLGMAWYRIGDHKKAEQYFKQALMAAPFSEEVVLDIADFYLKAKKNIDKAYLVVTNAVRRNPHSLVLQKSYAMRALEMGLDTYADLALKTIKDMTSEVDFKAFEEKYLQYKEVLEERRLSVK